MTLSRAISGLYQAVKSDCGTSNVPFEFKFLFHFMYTISSGILQRNILLDIDLQLLGAGEWKVVQREF